MRARLRGLVRKARVFIGRPRVVWRDRLVVMEGADGDADGLHRPCDRPIFLIGLWRSGTTLLRQVVDSHSSIACPPESLFLEPLGEFASHRFFREGMSNLGFAEEAAARQLGRGMGAFFDAYRISKGKARWADKTPNYTFMLPMIESLFGPGCQYVMLYRHPLDVAYSIFSKGWRDRRYDDDLLTNTAMAVSDGLARQLAFQAEHADRCYELRYEAMTADPAAALQPMFEFLGEPWEPAVLDYHKHPHDFGLGDDQAQIGKGFRANTGNWRQFNDAQLGVLRRHLGDWMDRLGYA